MKNFFLEKKLQNVWNKFQSEILVLNEDILLTKVVITECFGFKQCFLVYSITEIIFQNSVFKNKFKNNWLILRDLNNKIVMYTNYVYY